MRKYLFLTLCAVFVAHSCGKNHPFSDLCDGTKALVAMPGSGCRKFVSCQGRNATRDDQHCGAGTLFDEETGKCEHEHEVRCNDPVGKDRKPAFKNYNTDCVEGPLEGACQNFTICHKGEPFHFSCNIDLVMNRATGMCDYPWQLSPDDQEYCAISSRPPWADSSPFLAKLLSK